MQRLVRSNGTLQFHFGGRDGRVDIQFLPAQPMLGNADITNHAVHTVRSQRTLLVCSLHAAVNGDVLLYNLRTHSYGNHRSGNANGVVGEADMVLSVMPFQISYRFQVQVIGLSGILRYAMQYGYIVVITGDNLQSIVQFLLACHTGGKDDRNPGFCHHFQQRQVGKVAACHLEAVGRKELQ